MIPAHPRVGGENDDTGGESRTINGSSPRGRGKRLGELIEVFDVGLIPAWAGKTRDAQLTCHALEAHPRVGGENLDKGAAGLMASGSSPRGRGKP